MADMDGRSEHKEFHAGVPQVTEGFFLKGSAHYDWGLKNRLARIFDPKSGRTVMLAFDHGYFQGPTTGLERIDLSIVPLIPYADTLMLTRGALRTMIPSGESICSLISKFSPNFSNPDSEIPFRVLILYLTIVDCK